VRFNRDYDERTNNAGHRVLLCKIWGSHSGGYEEYYLLGYYAV
jgi:hypothetical protein